jgi:hypothetical protein
LSSTCGILERKIDEIDAKLAELAAIRRTLAQILDHHHERPEVSFAQAFDRHVEQLVSEAMARESQTSREQRRHHTPPGNGRLKSGKTP